MSDRTGPKKQSTPEALLDWLDDGAAALNDSHYEQIAALIRELQARIAALEAALQQISHEERQGMDYMEGYASLADQIAREALPLS